MAQNIILALTNVEKLIKTTTDNRVYKQARWSKNHHNKYNYYCTICRQRCMPKIIEKRNYGKMPKYKNRKRGLKALEKNK